MNLFWDEKAWLEYLYWQTQDKKTLKRINNLLKDIDRNGYNCIGKPEPLKGDQSGWWSVRIDEKKIVWYSEYHMTRWKYLNAEHITATNNKKALRRCVRGFSR